MSVASEVLRNATASKTVLARNDFPGRISSLAMPRAKNIALPRIFELVAWNVIAWNM